MKCGGTNPIKEQLGERQQQVGEVSLGKILEMKRSMILKVNENITLGLCLKSRTLIPNSS